MGQQKITFEFPVDSTMTTGVAFANRLPNRAGRQSVRTTFRLTPEGQEALTWLADRHDATMKDTIQTVVDSVRELRREEVSFQQFLAAANAVSMAGATRRAQVVSKETLVVLSDLARTCAVPRDRLLVAALMFFRDAMLKQEEALLKDHERALKLIRDACDRAEVAGEKLRALLQEDDPIVYRFSSAVAAMDSLADDVMLELKTGVPVDPGSE